MSLQLSKRLVFVTALIVIALDQLTKFTVVQNISEGDRISVLEGIFDLTLTFNKGIAFGLLSGVPDPLRSILLAIAVSIALATVVYFLFRHYPRDAVAHFALALIVGGAVGNIIDRLRLGKVIDFLDVYYGEHHWPAFNLADSAVCVGVCILLFRPAKAEKAVS